MSNSDRRQIRADEYLSLHAEDLEMTPANSEAGLRDLKLISDPTGSDWEWLANVEEKLTQADGNVEKDLPTRKSTQSKRIGGAIAGWVLAAMLAGIALFLVTQRSGNRDPNQLAVAEMTTVNERGSTEKVNALAVNCPFDGYVFAVEFRDDRAPLYNPDMGEILRVANGKSDPIRLSKSPFHSVVFFVTETPLGETCRTWLDEQEIEGVPDNLDGFRLSMVEMLKEFGFENIASGVFEAESPSLK